MLTTDSRVDYIRNSVFNCQSIVQVDQQLNLETIKPSTYLHVNSLTPDVLDHIFKKCQLIESLHFDSIAGDLNNVCPLGVDSSSDSNFNLQEDAIRHLPKLVGLRILICPPDIDESNLCFLLANCPNLETLVICFAREQEANHRISGECFKYLGGNIKHLIFGNLIIKQTTIDNLLNSNGRLVQEIEILAPLGESQFDQVLNLSNLRKLTFKACYCSYMQIREISTLSNLESLAIERLEMVHDTLEELFSPVFEKCRKLKQFKVSGVFKMYSYQLFDMIKENNLQLTHLHIHPNMYKRDLRHLKINISDSIDSLCSLKQLQSLSLTYSDLADEHLQSLLDNCPHLTTIDLSYCNSIASTAYIVNHAEKNPQQNYSIFLQSTKITSLPKLPDNLKLCICNCERLRCLPLRPTSFYDLI